MRWAHSGVMRFVAVLVSMAPAVAHADSARLLTDHTFDVNEGGPLTADMGLLVDKPSSLPTGLSTGIGAGITRSCGCLWSYGARISWGRVAEPGTEWLTTQDDFRMRLTGAIRHDAGRGSIALRLAAGPTLVHEGRDRLQGMRLGLTGDDLHTSATRMLPAAELEAVVTLKIVGDWGFVASGGPSFDVLSGAAHWGWVSQLGVGWNP